MSTNTPPFEIGEEVVCVDDSPHHYSLLRLKRNDKYLIEGIETFNYGAPPELVLSGLLGVSWRMSRFRRIPPYQNSVSKELAEQALETVKDNQDIVPVRKEVEV